MNPTVLPIQVESGRGLRGCILNITSTNVRLTLFKPGLINCFMKVSSRPTSVV